MVPGYLLNHVRQTPTNTTTIYFIISQADIVKLHKLHILVISSLTPTLKLKCVLHHRFRWLQSKCNSRMSKGRCRKFSSYFWLSLSSSCKLSSKALLPYWYFLSSKYNPKFPRTSATTSPKDFLITTSAKNPSMKPISCISLWATNTVASQKKEAQSSILWKKDWSFTYNGSKNSAQSTKLPNVRYLQQEIKNLIIWVNKVESKQSSFHNGNLNY